MNLPRTSIETSELKLFKLFLLLTHLFATTVAESRRPGFPEVADVSRDRPVTSHPASAVCGLPTVDSFCRSTSSAESVRTCLLASCTGKLAVVIRAKVSKMNGGYTCTGAVSS